MAPTPKIPTPKMPEPPATGRPNNGGQAQLPRTHNLPPAGYHNEYADEAARAAQRYYEQVNQIADLTRQLDEWRGRALAAEQDIARLENRLHDEQQHHGLTREELVKERDEYKNRLLALVAQFHVAGDVILKAIDTATKIVPTPKVDMRALANEIDKDFAEVDEPLPSIVARGPATE